MLNIEAIEAFSLPQLRYHLQQYNLPTTGGPKGGVKKFLQEKLKAHILSMNDPSQPSVIGDQEPENMYPDRMDGTMGDTLDDIRDLNMLKQIFNWTANWRRNVFNVPSGRLGKEYVMEMTKLIEAWSNKLENSSVALYGLMIMPKLLLQKPTYNVKAKVIKEVMERRLKNGKNVSLRLCTRRPIQSRAV